MTLFVIALALTVVVLALVVWSGVSRRRPLHYGCVVSLFAALGWAIYEAEAYGRGLLFEGPAEVVKQLHFGAVAIAFLAVPVLLVTGVRLARDETLRPLHRSAATFFVVIVLVCCALGTAMTLLAEPRTN